MTDSARDVIAEELKDHGADFLADSRADIADTILTALREAGFAVVPVEPTEAMLTAMHEAWISWKGEDFDRWNHCLIAAIKAAQGGTDE